MTNKVLLIHGWSAAAESMAPVGRFLGARGFDVEEIKLGAYPSMDDVVHIQDSARRLQGALEEKRAEGRLTGRFHLVVHSTGALVARRWLLDQFPSGGSPVENFLMLAPANFGSPLATIGRSAIGRLFKGWKRGFQTGTHFLNGLELGSKLQETIALGDRLSPDGETASPFSEEGCRPYVIVGADPIFGTQILGEEAWDGTVRIASANIDPQGATVRFRSDALTEPEITPWTRRGPEATPFAVLPDRTHLSILDPSPGASASKDPITAGRLGDLILQALRVDSAGGYREAAGAWEQICLETRDLVAKGEAGDALRKRILGGARANTDRFREYYQLVLDVRDEAGFPVDDYELWLTVAKAGQTEFRGDKQLTQIEIDARRNLIKHDHRNTNNPERRVLHLDRRALMQRGGVMRGRGRDLDTHFLAAGLTAASPGKKIFYFTKGAREASGLIKLREEGGPKFLRRYSTHFLRVIIPRVLDDSVFEIKDLPPG